MGRYLDVSDLQDFAPDIPAAKAAAMIDDAEYMALLVAPCLDYDSEDYDLSDNRQGAVKAILRGVVLRWNEAGTGAFQQTTTGPFGATVDTRQQRRGMFWPSEIDQLQSVCNADQPNGGAFAVDTTGFGCVHADICAINFGALYCSCGADLTNYEYPLYETQGQWP
jgi:hypothetical protein